MTDVAFRPGVFSAVTAFFSLIHVPRDEQPDVLGATRSWLKPEGLLVVTMGVSESEGSIGSFLGTPMYWSSWSRAENVRLVEQAGQERRCSDWQRELREQGAFRNSRQMQFHGKPIPPDRDPMFVWRIKSQGNDEARQQFLDGYVPQIWELGLTVPDPELRKDEETGRWHYTEPDWDELMSVVTGHGPKTEERLDLRRAARENSAWVRSVLLAA
jgi:hypothetical protein